MKGQWWGSWEAAGIWGQFCREKHNSGSAGLLSAAFAAALEIEMKVLLFETSRTWAAF